MQTTRQVCLQSRNALIVKEEPFEIIYGFNLSTALDLLPLPLYERTNMDLDKRTEYMKMLHESTRATLEMHNNHHATKVNKSKKPQAHGDGNGPFKFPG